MTELRIEQLRVLPTRPMREAMQIMDKARLGIVLVTDAGRNLLGTITDGDIRRAILGAQDFGRFLHLLFALLTLISPRLRTRYVSC